MLSLNEINSPESQELLRLADMVMTFDPTTGTGVTLDGQLSVTHHRPLPLPAHWLALVHIIAASAEEIEQARKATEHAKGRILHIDRQKEIAANMAKFKALAMA